MRNYQKIEFLSENHKALKDEIISLILNVKDINHVLEKIDSNLINLIKEINDNSSIQIIFKNKSDQDILHLLNEILKEKTGRFEENRIFRKN